MSLRRALSLSYIEKYGSYAISLASTIILSRLLDPKEIGVFAVGMSLVGIVAVLREFGISSYIIQERNLTVPRSRAAFTLTVSIGSLLALALLALSIPAGLFYSDTRVASVIAILSLGFAITPLGSISQALMARDMQFGRLTYIRLLYALVSSVTAIILAKLGVGPASLAWATVAASASNSVVSMLFRPHSIKLNFSLPDLRRVFSVGGPATAIAIVDDILASLPELLIGRIRGLADAGLFSRSKGLSQMAHQLLARASAPVFLSAFARLDRNGEPVGPLYLRATACVTVLGWTLLGVLAVLAEPIVLILFGPTWLAVVPVLRWLSVAAAVSLLTSGATHLLIACGGAKDVFYAKAIAFPLQVLALAIGAYFGPVVMAMAAVVSAVVANLFIFRAVVRRTKITLAEQLKPVWLGIPITAAAVMGALPALLIAHSGIWGGVASVLGGSVCAALTGLLVLRFTEHPLKTEALKGLTSIQGRFSKRFKSAEIQAK